MSIVHLNVGGTFYSVSMQTLIFPSDYFSEMLSKQKEPGGLVEGRIFIDRNGDLFTHVVNYMRNLDNWHAPENPNLLLDLINEAQYYRLNGMLEKIKHRVPKRKETFSIIFCEQYRQVGTDNYELIKDQMIKLCDVNKLSTEKGFAYYSVLANKIFSIDDFYSGLIEDYTLLSNTNKEDDGYYVYTFVDRLSSPIYAEIRARLY